MKLIRVAGILLFFFLAANMVQAQETYLEKADRTLYKEQKYFEAIEMYKKAYTKEDSRDVKAEIIFKIAEAYRLSDRMEQAEVWYDKAVIAQFSDPIALYHLGEVKMLNGKYDEAVSAFQRYVAEAPSDPKGQVGIQSAEKAQKWKDNPTKYIVEPVVLINSDQYDYSPVFVDRKNTELIFSSTREGSTGTDLSEVTGQYFPDLYFTKRDKKGKWSEPVLAEGLNTEASEAVASPNARRNLLYFTRCIVEKDKATGCQIYKAQKQGVKYGTPEMVTIAADSVADSVKIGHPAVSADDKTIVFTANLPGGFGGKDLWYISQESRNKWSEPINLGSTVNTDKDEMFPFLHNNGDLYFASNGHMGMGGLDIFMAPKLGDNQWGKVENLKSPINSNANDFGIVFDGDNDRGYFTSSREGGKGLDDVWEFSNPPLLFELLTKVVDLETGEILTAAKVQLIGTDGTNVEKETDVDGVAQFELDPETSYSILVSKVGSHLNARGKETTVAIGESKRFAHLYELQPITDEEIKLPDILYEFNSANLTPQAKDSLDYLYNILVDNPNITIELGSHTDSRGSPEYNLKLSDARAASAVAFLVSRGIAADRMESKGYGESTLLISDNEIEKLATEEEREAAHQLNRRTVFSILSQDYVPKDQPEGDGTDTEAPAEGGEGSSEE